MRGAADSMHALPGLPSGRPTVRLRSLEALQGRGQRTPTGRRSLSLKEGGREEQERRADEPISLLTALTGDAHATPESHIPDPSFHPQA